MAIAPFPHTYSVRLENEHVVAGTRPSIPAGPPPQFGGSDVVWSPEHLLLAATLSCLKTTFDAYARSERITVYSWRGTATGTLEKTKGGPSFSAIELDVEIETSDGDQARAEATLATAERNCIISRTLAVPVDVHCRATATRERAAG